MTETKYLTSRGETLLTKKSDLQTTVQMIAERIITVEKRKEGRKNIQNNVKRRLIY